MKRYILLFIFLAAAGCGRIAGLHNAKWCGDYGIHCAEVKKGMYHCRIYSKKTGELVREQTYIYPVFYGPGKVNVHDKIVKYDGDTIYLEGNEKLVACDVPEDAALVQSINGAVWISYRLENAKQMLYTCTMYNVKDGAIVSRGAYRLKRHQWDERATKMKYVDANARMRYLDFVYYGGVGVSLKNKMVLMPAGPIEYPDGPRSGLRVKYDDEGNVAGREEY